MLSNACLQPVAQLLSSDHMLMKNEGLIAIIMVVANSGGKILPAHFDSVQRSNNTFRKNFNKKLDAQSMRRICRTLEKPVEKLRVGLSFKVWLTILIRHVLKG